MTYKEATGTVITEALAIGIPVIASEICGYAHYAAELEEHLVIPEPFVQEECNAVLSYALAHLPELSAKALSPDLPRDFYRRAEVIVDHLENAARQS